MTLVERDPLQQLLRDADDRISAPPARDARELASRVRTRHARRRNFHRSAVGAGVAVAAAVVCLVSLPRSDPRVPVVVTRIEPPLTQTPVQPAAIAHLRARQRRLEGEADAREAALVGLVEATGRRARPHGSRSARPVELRLELRREEATLLLLNQGDALAREPDLRGRAEVAYRQAAGLFPETRGAAVAKQRLDALN
jgi:hypothetical protein